MAENNVVTQKMINVVVIRTAAGLSGSLAGAYMAYRADAGFWGYVGRILLGGAIVGMAASLATLGMAAKAVQEGIEESKTNGDEKEEFHNIEGKRRRRMYAKRKRQFQRAETRMFKYCIRHPNSFGC